VSGTSEVGTYDIPAGDAEEKGEGQGGHGEEGMKGSAWQEGRGDQREWVGGGIEAREKGVWVRVEHT
jgi:hypothetical protein